MGDYCDGIHFKHHSLFSSEPRALQIILYYDGLKLCNPLGTSAKIHKVGKRIILLYVTCDIMRCRSILLSVGKPEPKI